MKKTLTLFVLLFTLSGKSADYVAAKAGDEVWTRAFEKYVTTSLTTVMLTSDIRFFVTNRTKDELGKARLEATALACISSAGMTGQRGAYFVCNAILGEVEKGFWVVLPSGLPHNGYHSCSALRADEVKSSEYKSLISCPTAEK